MARTGFTGFAAGDRGIDNIGSAGAALPSGVTYETTIVRTGARSLKVVPASGSSASNVTTNFSNVGYARFYLRVTSRPATTQRLIFGSKASPQIAIGLNPSGTLEFWTGSTSLGTSTTALTDTTKWYLIEVRAADSLVSVAYLRIDSNDQVVNNVTGFIISPRIGCNDTVADTYTAYFADYTQDDTTYPGPGAVALLLPISDNARGAKWFAGTAGTTGLWDAVNNLPPAGVTSPQTTTSAITHAGGGVNPEDYDANMTTYSSAGLSAGDTVNAVRAVVIHGEDIATGTKLLTFSVKSNPAQGAFETNFSAGADVGAVGAYPTNWTATHGTIISAPSVTVASSPVLSVRRPETASRLADVCFMGLYVDYTPAAATFGFPFPRKNGRIVPLI